MPIEVVQTEEHNRCEECGSELIKTTSDVVCQSCGLVSSPNYVEPSIPHKLDENPSFGVSEGLRLHIADSMGTFVGYYGQNNRSKDYSGITG